MGKFDKEFDDLVAHLNEFKNVLVTTTDLKQPYRVIGPIMSYQSNMGTYAEDFKVVKERYSKPPYSLLLTSINEITEKYPDSCKIAQKLFYGAFHKDEAIESFQSEMDIAQAIGMSQLKLRAASIGANAVVGIRFETDFDTSSKNLFFLKIYGTAVYCDALADTRIFMEMDKDKSLV